MLVDRLDHLVLTVRSVQATCEFYTRVLGLEVITFGDDRKALRFGKQKINLHEAGNELEPKALAPTPGAGDFCFIITTPLEAAIEQIQSCGVAVIAGPIMRTGAISSIRSIYLRDPDGNLIELASDRPEDGR